MSQCSKEILEAADKALRSRKSGRSWAADTAIPTLCSVAKTIKSTDTERKEATAPHRQKQIEVEAPFKAILGDLKIRDAKLRARLLEEYESSEGITVEGIGNASFTEKWVYDITDDGKVDKAYRTAVDHTAIKEAIANGIRSIKGVTIRSERTLRITPSKGA